MFAETDQGGVWNDDGRNSAETSRQTSDMDREWQKRHDQFYMIGYRDGLIAGKEFATQEGFNIGFKDSDSTTCGWGFVRRVTGAMACLPTGLMEKLVEGEELRCSLQSLHESVKSMSTTDALKLFYEDNNQRKSEDRLEIAESDSITECLKHHCTETGVFEIYYKQLQSIVSDSPA